MVKPGAFVSVGLEVWALWSVEVRAVFDPRAIYMCSNQVRLSGAKVWGKVWAELDSVWSNRV